MDEINKLDSTRDRKELDQKMKDFSELQNWNVDSDKKHIIKIENIKRQLNKYCQQHLDILRQVFGQKVPEYIT